MRNFFEAFVYFVESGLPEKLAKELAESVTGIKAPKDKIKIPETKSPEVFQTPKAADDVIEVSDDVSPGYAQGDTKYNADVLATGLAEKRGFIKEGQDSTDMDVKKYSELYSEAYQYLTDLRRLNKPVKRSSIPKKLVTRKERGELNFITSKISNPIKSKFVLEGLDGTTESLYNTFRREKESIKRGMVQQMNRAKENNMAISKKDLDNILYNLKIYKQLDDKVNQLSNDLIDAGKEPEKIYKNFTSPQDDNILTSMEESIRKIQQLSKEINDIQSGAKAKKDKIDNDARIKNLYQGRGYGPNEAIFRTLTRQFLRDEIEAGTISVRPAIYNAMKEGNHPFIDPIKVFRYHYGDDKFNNLSAYIDATYDFNQGSMYPGRFRFRQLDLVPLNKNAPGNTYEHYSLPGEIDQQIADVDRVIKSIETGDNPFLKGPEDIKNQNAKRANLVKIKNEIMPETTQELPGDELLESAEVIEFPKIDDTTDFARGGIVEVLI
tara:strand:- start:2425 stop:3906 length:1482 start_codon:yes stop_codon:yes gene_type:complete